LEREGSQIPLRYIQATSLSDFRANDYNMSMILRSNHSVPFLVPNSSVEGVGIVVTTRAGGVSSGSYSSLNLGLHTGDDSTVVLENRHRLARAVGFSPDRAVWLQQIHGDSIAVVSESDAGRGGQSYVDGLPGTDGAITGTRGIVLTVLIADCATIVLVDRARNAIAIAHAGWRGTLSRLSTKLLNAMIETFGSQPREVSAFISPAIGPCCLDVRRVVAEEFSSQWGEDAHRHLTSDLSNRPRLNLWSSNAALLHAGGVTEIEVADLCTKCNSELFFSHRGQGGKAGRFVTQVFLT